MAELPALLASWLRDAERRSLLVADENLDGMDWQALAGRTRVLSNRCDIARQALAAGVDAQFSDFDFSGIEPVSLDAVCCCVSKEKPVVHHIANRSICRLKPGGQLVLAGAKQTGIKTYAKTIAGLFGGNARIEKHGSNYLAVIDRAGQQPGPSLDDQNYDRLRPIFNLGERPVLSKPGLFGWNKLDRGSQLLVEQLPTFLENSGKTPATALDLGCGYGYLSLAAARLGVQRITATDNCAAAILACRANFAGHGVVGEVIADDCGKSIEEHFDCLLCNPPFHQGFARDCRLTDRFLGSARRLLRPGGRALFVVNRFVPLESRARALFRRILTVSDNGSFKVVQLA